MNAHTVTDQAGLREAANRLIEQDWCKSPIEEQVRAWTEREGVVVVDDLGGVLTASVLRNPADGAPSIWLNYVVGSKASWPGLMAEACYEAVRRGIQNLPLYRIADPKSPISKHYRILDSDILETRADGKLVLGTTVKRILEALKALGVAVDATALARCR